MKTWRCLIISSRPKRPPYIPNEPEQIHFSGCLYASQYFMAIRRLFLRHIPLDKLDSADKLVCRFFLLHLRIYFCVFFISVFLATLSNYTMDQFICVFLWLCCFQYPSTDCACSSYSRSPFVVQIAQGEASERDFDSLCKHSLDEK